ncbi:MAG: hypothetical protein WDN26_14760 [Chitinophagaceae bacterium]
MNQQTKWSQFGVLVSVFFFWGFVAASNDVLIPFLKKNYTLRKYRPKWFRLPFM